MKKLLIFFLLLPVLLPAQIKKNKDSLMQVISKEDSNAVDVDGDQSNNTVSGSGAVYVFE